MPSSDVSSSGSDHFTNHDGTKAPPDDSKTQIRLDNELLDYYERLQIMITHPSAEPEFTTLYDCAELVRRLMTPYQLTNEKANLVNHIDAQAETTQSGHLKTRSATKRPRSCETQTGAGNVKRLHRERLPLDTSNVAEQPTSSQPPNLSPDKNPPAIFGFTNYKSKQQACPRLINSATCEYGTRCACTHDPVRVETARASLGYPRRSSHFSALPKSARQWGSQWVPDTTRPQELETLAPLTEAHRTTATSSITQGEPALFTSQKETVLSSTNGPTRPFNPDVEMDPNKMDWDAETNNYLKAKAYRIISEAELQDKRHLGL